jgi:hypothetical protein
MSIKYYEVTLWQRECTIAVDSVASGCRVRSCQSYSIAGNVGKAGIDGYQNGAD